MTRNTEHSSPHHKRARALPYLILAGLVLLVLVEGATCAMQRSEQDRSFDDFSRAAEGRAPRGDPALDTGALLWIRVGAVAVELGLGLTAVVLGFLGLRRPAGRNRAARQGNLVGLFGGVLLILIAAYLSLWLTGILIMSGAVL